MYLVFNKCNPKLSMERSLFNFPLPSAYHNLLQVILLLEKLSVLIKLCYF